MTGELFLGGVKIFGDAGVSGLLFWVKEPIGNNGDDKKFKKLHLSRKKMTGKLFSWVKTNFLE